VLTGQGGVDREAVESIVFDDEAERKRLESVVHAKVAAQREAKLAAAAADPSVRFVVLDVPLLAEVGWTERCDALVFVEAARSTRADRVRRSRGWDEAELARREKNQMRLDRKRDLAHYVVRNDASEAECLAQVREVVSRILEER